MKLRFIAATVAAFAMSSGAAVAQSAASSSSTSATAPSERALLSYAIGYEMARGMAERKVDLDVTTLVRAVQDGYAKRDPAMPGDKLAAALTNFQKRMADQERAEFERVSRENKSKSEAFLSANRSKPGVKVLASGVQYRVIEAGSGSKPTANSTVTVDLTGSVSTGQKFADTKGGDSPKPATFKISEFPLTGLKEVLLMMPVGARWEVTLPADKAYGNDPRSPVGPGQAVVFDIKLLSSK